MARNLRGAAVQSYANQDPREGTVLSEETITFNWRPMKILVINDSPTTALKFKFNQSEEFATLYPAEEFSAKMASRIIIIKSADGITSVPYRIWGMC